MASPKGHRQRYNTWVQSEEVQLLLVKLQQSYRDADVSQTEPDFWADLSALGLGAYANQKGSAVEALEMLRERAKAMADADGIGPVIMLPDGTLKRLN